MKYGISKLTEIGARHDAVVKLVETPPGPPVLATMVAEIYGDEATSYQELTAAAAQLAGHFRAEAGVREVDVMVSVPHDRVQFVLDRQQAAVHGVREAQLTRLLTTAVRGETVGDLRAEGERQPRNRGRGGGDRGGRAGQFSVTILTFCPTVRGRSASMPLSTSNRCTW